MNTMGKILVTLNFLFAVVVGGFLVVDFAARKDWKSYAEGLKRELEVAKRNGDGHNQANSDLGDKLKRAQLDVERARQDLKDFQDTGKATEQTLNLQVADLQEKLKAIDANLQLSLKEQERLKVESKQLLKTVADRESTVVKLEDTVKDYRSKAVSAQNLSQTLEQRNIQLLAQVQDLQKAMREMQIKGADSVVLKRNQPNPPEVLVEGKVTKVDSEDRSLVILSVGSEHGLKKDNTLEVFRGGNQPLYLGMVRVQDVRSHVSVGRLMANALGVTPQVREGDQIRSSLK